MRTQSLNIIILILFLLTMKDFSIAQEGRGKGRIFGTVKDENDNPLEKAEVVCISLQYNFTLKTTSNKKGQWAIMGLGRGVCRITASKSGYLPSEIQMMVSQFENPPIDFVLKTVETADIQTIEAGEASRQIFQEGTILYEQGKYSTALQLFQEFLEKNPNLFQIRINIGNCYREMSEYEKAIDEYNIVLEKLKEKNPDLHGNKNAAMGLTNIGETYLKMNEAEKAKQYLKEAVEIFPNDHALAYNVAEIYFKGGEIDQAIEYYTLATQVKPDWPLAYLKRGYAYLNKASYEEAITSFKKFLELAPDDSEAEKIRNLITQLEKMK